MFSGEHASSFMRYYESIVGRFPKYELDDEDLRKDVYSKVKTNRMMTAKVRDKLKIAIPLLESGMSTRQVAKQMGVQHRGLYGLLTKYGHIQTKRKFKVDHQEAAKMLKDGKSTKEIAAHFNVTSSYIRQLVKNGKLGLTKTK